VTQPKRILLVEDNPREVELTLATLKANNFAMEVDVARDGVEALDYLYRRGAFANRANSRSVVVFLDLKMPRVDGLEVLRQIKTDPKLKRVPVVVVTSSRETQDLITSYELGANAYVVKPIGYTECVDILKLLSSFWIGVNELPPVPE